MARFIAIRGLLFRRLVTPRPPLAFSRSQPSLPLSLCDPFSFVTPRPTRLSLHDLFGGPSSSRPTTAFPKDWTLRSSRRETKVRGAKIGNEKSSTTTHTVPGLDPGSSSSRPITASQKTGPSGQAGGRRKKERGAEKEVPKEIITNLAPHAKYACNTRR